MIIGYNNNSCIHKQHNNGECVYFSDYIVFIFVRYFVGFTRTNIFYVYLPDIGFVVYNEKLIISKFPDAVLMVMEHDLLFRLNPITDCKAKILRKCKM